MYLARGAYLINRSIHVFNGQGDQVHRPTLYRVLGAESVEYQVKHCYVQELRLHIRPPSAVLIVSSVEWSYFTLVTVQNS